MKRIPLTLVILLIVATASASPATLFARYETVRQNLLKGSLAAVQSSARELAGAALAEKQAKIAERASALTSSANLQAARDSFGALSDELIRFRNAQNGDRPVVVYCSMAKKSWLQPKGEINNPYANEPSMKKCGQVTQQ